MMAVRAWISVADVPLIIFGGALIAVIVGMALFAIAIVVGVRKK
jgi:hypothetical protein